MKFSLGAEIGSLTSGDGPLSFRKNSEGGCKVTRRDDPLSPTSLAEVSLLGCSKVSQTLDGTHQVPR